MFPRTHFARVHPRKVFRQDLVIKVIISYYNLIAIDQMKKNRALTKISPSTREMPKWKRS